MINLVGSSREPRLPPCLRCGTEAWKIAYGEYFPDVQETMPNTVFAGCCVEMLEQISLRTGLLERKSARWKCQNRSCGFRWW